MAPAISSPGACLGFLLVDAAGAPLHRAARSMVPAHLGSYRKPFGGRRVVVAAATPTPAAPAPGSDGGDGHRLPSSGKEVAYGFWLEMEAFKLSYHPETLFPTPSEMEAFELSYHPLTLFATTSETVEAAYGTAIDCMAMLEFLLSKQTVRPNIHQGLVLAGKAFLTVEHNAAQQCLRADALLNGIRGLKLIGKVFFERELLPEDKVPEIPSSKDDYIIDEESFCRELVRLFDLHRAAVYAEAKSNYSYGTRGAKEGDLPSADCERPVSDFCNEMDAFKAWLRPTTAVLWRTDLQVETALSEAKRSLSMLEFLLAESTAYQHPGIPKEVIAAGKAFIVIEHQILHHYLVENDLGNAIQGLQAIGTEFLGIDLADRYAVPSAQFFQERLVTFCDSSRALRSLVMEMYGFTTESAI